MLQVMGVGMGGWGRVSGRGEVIVWSNGMGMERGGGLEVKKGGHSPTPSPPPIKKSLTFSLKHSHTYH